MFLGISNYYLEFYQIFHIITILSVDLFLDISYCPQSFLYCFKGEIASTANVHTISCQVISKYFPRFFQSICIVFFINIFHVLSLSLCPSQVFGIVSKREMAAHSSHNFPSSIFTSIYRKGVSFLPGRQMEKLSQTHFMNRFKLLIKFLLLCSIKLNQFICFLPWVSTV